MASPPQGDRTSVYANPSSLNASHVMLRRLLARSSRTPPARCRADPQKAPTPPCRPRSAPRDRPGSDTPRSRSPGTQSSAACCRRQAQRRAVAAGQQIVLAALAAIPHRADRVDDVLRRQPITAGDLGRSGGAAAERFAFLQQLASGGAVDRTIDPAAAQQRCVCRVDDGIDRERGDVGDHDLQSRRTDFGGEKRKRHRGTLARLTGPRAARLLVQTGEELDAGKIRASPGWCWLTLAPLPPRRRTGRRRGRSMSWSASAPAAAPTSPPASSLSRSVRRSASASWWRTSPAPAAPSPATCGQGAEGRLQRVDDQRRPHRVGGDDQVAGLRRGEGFRPGRPGRQLRLCRAGAERLACDRPAKPDRPRQAESQAS